MKNMTRVIAITMLGLAVSPLTVHTQLGSQGPPSDRPAQGELHRADPCALGGEPQGEAEGIERRCALGASAGVARGDFNNDGFADLAVGAPDETRQSTTFDPVNFRLTLTDHPGAGAVNIIYGSAGGLTPTGSQVIGQGFTATTTNAHFGRALAAGRFRGPNFASDLAVGVPGASNGGAIYVFFSASGRLNTSASQIFHADRFSGAGTVLGAGVTFRFPDNMSMVWGDFNGDSVGDLVAELAISGNANGRSAVVVIYGVAGTGLSLATHTVLVVDDGLSPNNFNPATGCVVRHFCATSRGHVTLSAGNLNGDARDDLLIGAPNCIEIEDDGAPVGSGAPEGCVAIVPGSASGLQRFFSWSALVPSGDSDRGGGFGLALAVADFNGNGVNDVAVGTPDNFRLLPNDAGMVRVFPDPGTPSGQQSRGAPSVLLTQGNVPNQTPEADDRFGAALAAKDFNGDGFADLAIGTPGESSGNNIAFGVVSVFRGSGTGLPGTAAAVTFAGPATGVLCCWNGARFGSSLTAWNFGLTAEADLMIGSPFFTIQSPFTGGVVSGAGSVLALYGLPGAGLTPLGMQLWTQNPGFVVCSPGAIVCLSTAGRARAGNHFGASLY